MQSIPFFLDRTRIELYYEVVQSTSGSHLIFLRFVAPTPGIWTIQVYASVRISREGKQIFEGPLASLKRFKDDVKEVKAGYECGLVFEGFNDIQELDQVEAYIMVEVPR